jgi:hypothetical protein
MTTELARQRAAIEKSYRAAVRLKYSILADDEIARGLAELKTQMDEALSRGEPFAFNPGSVFDEVDS